MSRLPPSSRARPDLTFLWLAVAVVFAIEILLALITLSGQHVGSDFVEFWTVSKIGLAGHAPTAYDPEILLRAERTVVPTLRDSTPWFYPPPFYLVVLPLALLPYLPSYWLFMILGLAAYVFTLRRIVSGPVAMACIAGFSGLWINLLYGQNGFLTATLVAAALLLLPRRPTLAGVFLGLLVIKPQLALLFPAALIAIGAWRALVSAVLTAAAFFALSTAALGTASLKASFAGAAFARHLLETGVCEDKMPSVFGFVRALGLSLPLAYALQALVAALVIVAVCKLWRTSGDWHLRSAALMTGSFLISPYVMVYDLAGLSFPIAWLALAGWRSGWLRGEREALIAAWLLPLFLSPVATHLHLRVGPWILGALLWAVVRRAGFATAPDHVESQHRLELEIPREAAVL